RRLRSARTHLNGGSGDRPASRRIGGSPVRLQSTIVLRLALVGMALWRMPAFSQQEHPSTAEATRFEDLSDAQKQQLRDRLRDFKARPKSEQERIRQNRERWRALPPSEKERISQNLIAFQKLRPDEQQHLRAAFHHFHSLDKQEQDELRAQMRAYLQANP